MVWETPVSQYISKIKIIRLVQCHALHLVRCMRANSNKAREFLVYNTGVNCFNKMYFQFVIFHFFSCPKAKKRHWDVCLFCLYISFKIFSVFHFSFLFRRKKSVVIICATFKQKPTLPYIQYDNNIVILHVSYQRSKDFCCCLNEIFLFLLAWHFHFFSHLKPVCF